jgi:hypothetical protein
MIDSLGDVGATLTEARPAGLSRLYQKLRLQIRYEPGEQAAHVTAQPRVASARVRGGVEHGFVAHPRKQVLMRISRAVRWGVAVALSAMFLGEVPLGQRAGLQSVDLSLIFVKNGLTVRRYVDHVSLASSSVGGRRSVIRVILEDFFFLVARLFPVDPGSLSGCVAGSAPRGRRRRGC